MELLDFDDSLVAAVVAGKRLLSSAERKFLIGDTPRIKGCPFSHEQLASLGDADLMATVDKVWAKYAAGL